LGLCAPPHFVSNFGPRPPPPPPSCVKFSGRFATDRVKFWASVGPPHFVSNFGPRPAPPCVKFSCRFAAVCQIFAGPGAPVSNFVSNFGPVKFRPTFGPQLCVKFSPGYGLLGCVKVFYYLLGILSFFYYLILRSTPVLF